MMEREPLVEDIQNYSLNIIDTVRERIARQKYINVLD